VSSSRQGKRSPQVRQRRRKAFGHSSHHLRRCYSVKAVCRRVMTSSVSTLLSTVSVSSSLLLGRRIRTALRAQLAATAACQCRRRTCAMDEQQLRVHQPRPTAVHAVEAAPSSRADCSAARAGNNPVCRGRSCHLWSLRVDADSGLRKTPYHRRLLETHDR